MPKTASTAIDLLAKALRRRELETQKAVWKTFGMNYEAEKAKQQAIWNELQQKREKSESFLQKRYMLKFLQALNKVDTQLEKEKMIKDLAHLAKLADKHAIDENAKLQPYERLKWARIEALIYQIINMVIVTPQDPVEIKQKLDELKKTVKHELKKKKFP